VKITEYLIAICLYVKISQETFHRDCLKHISHISGPFRGVHGKWEYVFILAGLIQPRECFFTKINKDCYIITHAGCIAAGVGRAFSCVCLFSCLFVRALKGKRLELSTPNLVHTYSIVDAQHALTQRSKGQRSRSHGYENRHGRTVASDACCCCRRGSACRYDCLRFLVLGMKRLLQCCSVLLNRNLRRRPVLRVIGRVDVVISVSCCRPPRHCLLPLLAPSCSSMPTLSNLTTASVYRVSLSCFTTFVSR